MQESVKKTFDIAVIGGSDLIKIKKQLGGDDIFLKYKYVFSENGLVSFRDGEEFLSEVSIIFLTNSLFIYSFIIYSIYYLIHYLKYHSGFKFQF